MPEQETTETTETTTPVVENPEVVTSETKSDPKDSEVTPEYVAKLREEAASWRVKLRAEEEKAAKLAEKVTAYEREKLSEEEKRQLELDELRKENFELLNSKKKDKLEVAVAKSISTFSLADADATLQLLDKNSVEYDDNGYVTNIDTVLESTLEKYPFLKVTTKKPTVDPGATNPGTTRSKSLKLTRESVAAMSPEQRKQNAADIQAWMENGYQ